MNHVLDDPDHPEGRAVVDHLHKVGSRACPAFAGAIVADIRLGSQATRSTSGLADGSLQAGHLI